MSAVRVWVIEGMTDTKEWVPVSGEMSTNRRHAYRRINFIRRKFADYPPETFRLREYVRREATDVNS